ncbi:hypothetical protein FEDK69T_20490 [Flavobacterium enshiense DK69]|nr:hypothetical protein FEDK69T_20490 [Flavobacterium enshiense DK69]
MAAPFPNTVIPLTPYAALELLPISVITFPLIIASIFPAGTMIPATLLSPVRLKIDLMFLIVLFDITTPEVFVIKRIPPTFAKGDIEFVDDTPCTVLLSITVPFSFDTDIPLILSVAAPVPMVFPEITVPDCIATGPTISIPFLANEIVLFWNLFPEFTISATALIALPEVSIAARVVVEACPLTIQFLTVLLVAPVVAELANHTTAGNVDVLVFAMVKSFEFVPLFEPSIVT